jgi:hypothetical protein
MIPNPILSLAATWSAAASGREATIEPTVTAAIAVPVDDKNSRRVADFG